MISSRLTTFYGDSGSLPSIFTIPYSTPPDTPPTPPLAPFTVTPNFEMATSVQLSFVRPIDDGGQRILGYHVFTSNPHRNHHRHWIWNGMYSDTSIKSAVEYLLYFIIRLVKGHS